MWAKKTKKVLHERFYSLQKMLKKSSDAFTSDIDLFKADLFLL